MAIRSGIVLVSARPREREAKIAYGLRRYGIETALLYVQPPNYDVHKYFAHAVRCQNALEVAALLPLLRPRITHIFSYHADDVALAALNARCGKSVYDYKDCFESLIVRPEHPSVYAAQRALFESADGICCRDLQAWLYCRVNNVKPRGRRVLFLDYCWDRPQAIPLKQTGKTISTVLVGTFIVERNFPEAFAFEGFLRVAQLLTKHGIDVHIYPFFNFPFPQDMSDYQALAEKTGKLHLHSSVPADRLPEIVAQHDFGMCPGQGKLFGADPAAAYRHGCYRYPVQARVFDYLDAGVEVIVHPEVRFTRRLMERQNVGVAMDERFVRNPTAVLQARMDRDRPLRVRKARRYYAMERHIPRLLRFYASL
jgi:hypothetical protein